MSAARWLCVIAIPSGTPVRIAKPTATLTMETCSSVRSPMAGRLCRMNTSVSIASPAMGLRAPRLPGARQCSNCDRWSIVTRGGHAASRPKHEIVECPSTFVEVRPRHDRHPLPQRLPLLQQLARGPVICAEGYVFELERRGYLQAGAFVPEVVLEHPEAVTQLHRDFVHAGSDVVEALTYYAHREKLRVIGREKDLEPINRRALEIAKIGRRWRAARCWPAASATPTSTIPADPASHRAVRAMFEEQVQWAAEAGVDFIIGETFSYAQEALIALDVIKKAGQVAVITLAMHQADVTREDWTVADACKRLADAGADVVGLNCIRGPATMMPLLRADPRERSSPDGGAPRALPHTDKRTVVPVAVRYALSRAGAAGRSRSRSIRSPAIASRSPTSDARRWRWTSAISACAAAPVRITSARSPKPSASIRPAASIRADMSKHAFLGSHERIKQVQKDYADKL